MPPERRGSLSGPAAVAAQAARGLQAFSDKRGGLARPDPRPARAGAGRRRPPLELVVA